MKINTIDRQNLRLLQEAMLAALKPACQQFGVDVDIAGGNFGSTYATLKFKVAVVGDGGVVETPERQALKIYAHIYGVKPTDTDLELTHRGDKYKLVGIAINRDKYPMLLERVRDGKQILVTREEVVRAWYPQNVTANGGIVLQHAGKEAA